MTPLEAMAKAHWTDSENTAWENLLPEDRDHMISVMRSALLALAEAKNLPLDWIAGDDAQALRITEDFRAVIRAIAEAKA